MRALFAKRDGEPQIWWHVVHYDRRAKKKHFAKKLYLHVGDQVLGFYLSLFDSSALVDLTFSTTSDENFSFSLAIYKLFYFGFSISKLPIVNRLPGVKWTGKWGSGEREFRLSWRPWSWHWNIWTYPGESKNWWRDGHFDLADFLLGRKKCTTEQGARSSIAVIMPEGVYTGQANQVYRSWKRPRWHRIKQKSFVDIEMDTPIPVPGDGENDWDCRGDAIYGGSYAADSIEAGIEALRSIVIRQRSK